MESDHLPELSTIWDEAKINIEQGNNARTDKLCKVLRGLLYQY
jgi:hypothetical protein